MLATSSTLVAMSTARIRKNWAGKLFNVTSDDFRHSAGCRAAA
jgi:hypothetical protein